MTLSFHDKFIIAIYVIILLFYFFRLLIQKPKLRLIFFMFFKKCIFITILSLVIYMVSDQSLCDTPVTKTLFEKFFENKKLGTFLIFSGVTIGTSIYIYKKCYPIVDPYLTNLKTKELFISLENNNDQLITLNKNLIKNQNLSLENSCSSILVNKIQTGDLNLEVDANLPMLTPDVLEKMRSNNLVTLDTATKSIYNLKFLNSQELDINDIHYLLFIQKAITRKYNNLTPKIITHNELSGWLDVDKLAESLVILENQAYICRSLCDYLDSIDKLNKLQISKIFNHVIYKSEDILIVSGYCFFGITCFFTYGINPIPYEYFLKSFYRLIKIFN